MITNSPYLISIWQFPRVSIQMAVYLVLRKTLTKNKCKRIAKKHQGNNFRILNHINPDKDNKNKEKNISVLVKM